MPTEHLEILVEEPSAEAFLQTLLPAQFGASVSFCIHTFQGKSDLLNKLPSRLIGYSHWLPNEARIIVLTDRDDDDCIRLKEQMEAAAEKAGLASRNRSRGPAWQIVNRIACEELEAWFFGDWQAVHAAFPKTSSHVDNKSAFRDPDRILGGTWESLERILQQAGYYKGGLQKVDCAAKVARFMTPTSSKSSSFLTFWQAISEALT